MSRFATRFAGAVLLTLTGASAGASAGAATATAAPAIDGPIAPPADTLVAMALAAAPELAAKRERVAAARERAAPASALDDPMLEFSLQNADFPDWTVGEQEMSMLAVEIRQPLPFPGKRGDRRRAADAAALVPLAERVQTEREVAAAVRIEYARLYAIDRALSALAAARASMRTLEDAAASRYGAGTSGIDAQLAAQLALSRLDERREDLTAERRMAVASLNRYLDRDAAGAIGEVVTLDDPGAPPADAVTLAETNAPSVAIARATVELASRQTDVERAERRPDLSLSGGYGYRGDLGPVAMFRVGTELPLWRGGRQGPRIRASEHDLAAAQHDLQRAVAEVRAETTRRIADWERASAQVQRYRDAILPQSHTALEVARAGYQAGTGSFGTIVESFNLWLEAQEQLAAREGARYAARALLTALVTPYAAEPAEEELP